MSKPVSIKELEFGKLKNKTVHVFGWVKTFRSNRFISLNDGSTINDIQCVIDLDRDKVDVNQISNINTPDSQTISIQPWEKDKLPDIEKAIIDSNLGLNPMNNGDSILINIPPIKQ